MNLLKTLAAISSMTMLSRVTGLARDFLFARMFETRRDEQLDQPIRQVMTCNPVTMGPDVLLLRW